LLLKQYHVNPEDPRDRMGTEFAALEFMRAAEITCVPKPLWLDRERACAVYEYVPGVGADRTRMPRDIAQAVDFWARLDALSGSPEAQTLPLASEACLGPQALADNLTRRRARFVPELTLHADLLDFFRGEFDPLLEGALESLEKFWPVEEGELDLPQTTLSPSDFGFHNAVRTPEGELYFVDFEYFGRDDPAKLICDFALHPRMELGVGEIREFASRVLDRLDRRKPTARRLEAVYPLFCLKWSLIMLNEFLPDVYARRVFALHPGEAARRRAGRLTAARRMLGRARTGIGSVFPGGDGHGRA